MHIGDDVGPLQRRIASAAFRRRPSSGKNWHWAHIGHGKNPARMYRCTCMPAFRVGDEVRFPKAGAYERGVRNARR